MKTQTRVAWGLAAAGLACAVAAAALQGGWVAGLSAASAGLTSMAGLLGYINKPAA